MRYIFLILLCLSLQTGFSQIIKTVGISYTNGTPTYTPAKAGSWIALDTVTWRYYTYNGSTWLSEGFRIQTISGCSAPAYTPTKFQSVFVINACTAGQGGPELYFWTGSVWLQINEGQTYTEGTGIDITGTVITNTAPDQTVSLAEGTGIDVTGTYPNFTVTNTGAAALAGVVGQIPRFGTTTTITTESGSGENSLFWDATNNRMGVNNAAPLAPIHIGNRNSNPSTDAQILVSRTMTTAGIAGHSFSDGSDIANGESYNSYDARLNITANITGENGHYAAFQSIPAVATGVTLAEHFGLYDRVNNSGTITKYNAIRALGPSGTVGDYYGFNLTSVVANNATGFALQSATGTTTATGLTISGISSPAGISRGIQVTDVTGANARTIFTRGLNEFHTNQSGDQNLLMFTRGSVGTGDDMGFVFEAGSGATKYYSNRFASEYDATLRGDAVFYANQTGGSGLVSLVENARLKYNGVLNVQTGFQIGNTAASGSYLRGNGTNFVSSPLLIADMITNFTPTSSADAAGANGDFAYDSNYIYVKVGGSWKRTALSTF